MSCCICLGCWFYWRGGNTPSLHLRGPALSLIPAAPSRSMCHVCVSLHIKIQQVANSQESRIMARGKKGTGNHNWKLVPWFQGWCYGRQKCEAAAHTAMSETPWALGSSLHRDPQDSRSCLRLRRSLTNNHTLIFHKPKFAFWPRDC